MLARPTQLDVTGVVDLESPDAVAQAVNAVFAVRYGAAWNDALLQRALDDVGHAYFGEYPGLLACDTPYHDLRHTLDTALVMARLVDGYEANHTQDGLALGPGLALVGVLLALFHDIGFLRRADEAHLNGALLAREHEARSADFAEDYLRRTVLAEYAPLSALIYTTEIFRAPGPLLEHYPPAVAALGRMIGTADLLSQLADRGYLEKCRDFLYHEFVVGGLDRVRNDDGSETVLYASPEDLLRKTPGFFESLALKRLDHDFAGAYRYLETHFRGSDPYMAAVLSNIAFLREIIASGDFSRLRRKPESVTMSAADDPAP